MLLYQPHNCNSKQSIWQHEVFSQVLSTYLLNLLWKQQSGGCWYLVLSLTKACIKEQLKISRKQRCAKGRVFIYKFTIESFLVLSLQETIRCQHTSCSYVQHTLFPNILSYFMWKNDCSRALGLENNMPRHNVVHEPIALAHIDQNKQYHVEGGLKPTAKLRLQQSAADLELIIFKVFSNLSNSMILTVQLLPAWEQIFIFTIPQILFLL